ncbi:MAG TPA: ANTAR domain-containing protein [Actinomycetes bacterium]|jgi:ANTAR domain/Phosphoserine phosphatase RsbU, N-terminal domain|nr:ANTAR domain-containing protein [Actinomycetes bacterium]
MTAARDPHERLRRDYAPAFLQYLSERGESGLRAAYELGRRAVAQRLSVLDLAGIHHSLLLEVLKTHRTSQELERIARAASEFLVEALAVFEMTQRGFAELQAGAQARPGPAGEPNGRGRRQVVDRATGMVMERHGLTDQAAVEWLRRSAARQGTSVHEVATRLVRRQAP